MSSIINSDMTKILIINNKQKKMPVMCCRNRRIAYYSGWEWRTVLMEAHALTTDHGVFT